MIRNLKVLGLALVAVFAFSAMTATGASAQGKLTAAEPVTLKGEETGATYDNSLTAFPVGGVPARTHCPGSTMSGHKINNTPHQLIPSGEKRVTLTPHYTNCETVDASGNTFPTTVDMNGCDYEGEITGTTAGKTGTAYGFDVQIVCPAEKHIQITQFSSSSHVFRVCTITVTNTALTSDAHVGNDTSKNPDHLWVAGTVTNIKIHKSGLCGSATDNEAILHIDQTVKGFNAFNEQINVTITD